MNRYICETCGVQYESSVEVPEQCAICAEERQYTNPAGQSWTTLANMQKLKKYKNDILLEESGLYSITTNPSLLLDRQLISFKQRDSMYCGTASPI